MIKFTMNRLAIFALAFLFLTSCSDDDDFNPEDPDQGNTTSIADFVAESEDYSSLEAALDRADLTATLDNESENYTVFAPNNAAFSAFLTANGYASVDDVPVNELEQLLLNHVMAGVNMAADINAGYASTLAVEESSENNLSILIESGNSLMLNGASTVTNADIEVDNGVIHAVDAVVPIPTIATFASNDDNLEDLFTALEDTLSTNSILSVASDVDVDLTVFAPNNSAFLGLYEELGVNDIDDIDDALLQRTLANHVIAGMVATTENISTGYVNTEATFGDTENKLSMYINASNNVQLNGYSNVTTADIIATNGVVHIVDEVIQLPDVTTFVTADPNFSTLGNALGNEDLPVDLIPTLQSSNGAPFTVFAPTNEAFDNLLQELNVNGIDEIDTNVLLNSLSLHVITETNLRSEDLADGTVETYGGADLTVNANNATLTDPAGNTSTIILTDLQATNGVVHGIDTVLLP